MKQWPEDPTETVNFEELIGPVREALEELYELTLQAGYNFNYEGYDIGQREKATCLSPDELLTETYLSYVFDDQGRDPLDAILMLAFQLGVEQGRRMTQEQVEFYKNLYLQAAN